MRCFLALELDEAQRGFLAEAARPLRRLWPELRWVESSAYHLTLVFLGEIGEAGAAAARRALAALGGIGAAETSFAGLGTFPPRCESLRVLVAKLGSRAEGTEGCARVQAALIRALDAEARALGGPEGAALAEAAADGGRRFSAHVTLARAGRLPAPGSAALAAALAGRASGAPAPGREGGRGTRGGAVLGGESPWVLGRCVLYVSELRPRGPVYTEVASAELGPPPGPAAFNRSAESRT